MVSTSWSRNPRWSPPCKGLWYSTEALPSTLFRVKMHLDSLRSLSDFHHGKMGVFMRGADHVDFVCGSCKPYQRNAHFSAYMCLQAVAPGLLDCSSSHVRCTGLVTQVHTTESHTLVKVRSCQQTTHGINIKQIFVLDPMPLESVWSKIY